MNTSKDSPPPRIAYLVNQYPSVSHTFIRREIQGLEARGYHILRLAIRRGGAVADPQDAAEAERTIHLLERGLGRVALTGAFALMRRLGRALAAFGMALGMARRSDRGLARHLAYLLEAGALLGILERDGVVHVHVHFGTNAAAVARLIRRLGGPGYSMTIHGPDELDAPVGLSLGGKMRDAAFTVAITHYCASQLRRWVEYSEWSKIEIVHCTVSPRWLQGDAAVPPDADSLVCVGRLSAQKGQLLLLDAFAGALEKGARGRLVLVGDGEMRGVVEQRIAALGLEDRVEITGWCAEDEVRRRLRDARALVLASFAEGLPVVLMEALALGRPALVTRITGIPELVRDGVEGWLVTPGDTNALAEGIVRVLSAPAEELAAMGAAGRERVRQRHAVDTEAAKLDSLFRRYTGGQT